MKKIKIDKKKFILALLKNFSRSSNLDIAISSTLSQMKVGKDRIDEVKSEFLPNGFKSLMIEVNEIINERIKSDKLPRSFKNFWSFCYMVSWNKYDFSCCHYTP